MRTLIISPDTGMVKNSIISYKAASLQENKIPFRFSSHKKLKEEVVETKQKHRGLNNISFKQTNKNHWYTELTKMNGNIRHFLTLGDAIKHETLKL